MANDLRLLCAVNQTATFEARIRRILSITAAYYGLMSTQGVSCQAGGPLV